MKKDRILNPMIIEAIATLGHTQTICIADCGLPIPKGVRVIDVSVVKGIPTFLDVLTHVSSELVIESYVIASETETNSPNISEGVKDALSGIPYKTVSHSDFKKLTEEASCIIRTGEATPYANIILIGGVNF